MQYEPHRTTLSCNKLVVPLSTDLLSIPIDFVPPLHSGRVSPCPLNIVVVGCGLGGLAVAHTLASAGHNVTIIEAAPAIGDVGAGIQVSPNATRLLQRWGLGTALSLCAVKPEAVVFRRYATGERVGYTRWGDTMDEKYGAPYLHLHRADYHSLLLRLATASDRVTLRLGCTVVGCDPHASSPSITLQTGEAIEADLIVGADGIRSLIRSVVMGTTIQPRPTGDAAYRAVIACDILREDPELKAFVEVPEMTAWMAPQRHLMAYCIRNKKEFNLVLLHPDDGESVHDSTGEGNADKMRVDFADFEPRVQKLLSHVRSTLRWRLMDHEALDTWVHPGGRVVLLGDSCHPMLPYRAQGAAMAIEDAAVLGALFSRLSSVAHIPALLQAYQDIRLSRTSEAQKESRLNRHTFHLPDGPEQEYRDAAMRDAMHRELGLSHIHATSHCLEDESGNPNLWADSSKNLRSFGYDADAEVDMWWERYGDKLDKLGQANEAREMARL